MTPSPTTPRCWPSPGCRSRPCSVPAHQQEVHLDRVFMDLAGYNEMITVPGSIPSLVDRAMRTCLAGRTVSHLTFPNDLQVAPADAEPWPSVGPARIPATAPTFLGARAVPDAVSLERAAEGLNQGTKVAMLVGAGALGPARRSWPRPRRWPARSSRPCRARRPCPT